MAWSSHNLLPSSSQSGTKIWNRTLVERKNLEAMEQHWQQLNVVCQYLMLSTLAISLLPLPIKQAPTHPAKNKHAYPKWANYWAIRTPKGYSTMFIQPMHRESVFTILPGIVDTDEYYSPVLFPFVVNDPEFEGLIPKGTPIAQVIPFKRESWTMQFGGDKERKEQAKITAILDTKFFDRYKTMFRKNKEYK
jgi:hypothetical protein